MNRNIKHILWMAAALPLLLASCQQEELPDMSGASDATPLTITVTDGGYASTDKAATRAAENGYSTEFTVGDACGLYIVRGGTVVYDNVKLTVTTGTNGSLTWQPEADVTLGGGLPGEKYFLYYPYQSDMSGKTNASATDANGFFATFVSCWQPEYDQSTYAAYTASDLMTAAGTATKANGTLSLSFSMTHRMAMAVIEMPKTVYKFTDNADGAIPDCTVTSSADFTDSDAKPCRMADGTYRYIVYPNNPTMLIGSYDNGKREFWVPSYGITGSHYKTYKIDGATQTEKQTPLQMGDYFCKDSDNKWYIIPQEATPDGNVIGIVFYVGQHETDQSDYSKPLTEDGPTIPDGKVHGYVVALTDAHDDDTDRLRWEYGPKNEYDKKVDTSTSAWQGYSNSLKFHEFVDNETNKAAGWEMKHFPAALACETYGNRMLDQDGNDAKGKYDWQKPLAAPSNTCGWFFPVGSQLKYLYQNRSVLSARMDAVRSSVPADCIYRDKIKWFSTSLYWSSTEAPIISVNAQSVSFGDGGSKYNQKDYDYFVRAVLAF